MNNFLAYGDLFLVAKQHPFPYFSYPTKFDAISRTADVVMSLARNYMQRGAGYYEYFILNYIT